MTVKDGVPLKMTSHRLADFKKEKACEKCHFTENKLGAPLRVLPAKSLICMGCHSSSVTLNDPISIVSLILFYRWHWHHPLPSGLRGPLVDPSFSTP